MLKTPILLGIKYFRSRETGYLSFYALISIVGLSLGVATLIIVLSVMNGFEKELQNRILGVVPQLLITNDGPFDSRGNWLEQLRGKEEIIGYSPYVQSEVLVQNNFGTKPLLLAGIYPELEHQLSILPDFIIHGDIYSLSSQDGILIGSSLARSLNIEIGDSLRILTSELRGSIFGSIPRTIQVKVVAIFELKSELDASLILGHHDLVTKLLRYPEGTTQSIRIKPRDLFAVTETGYMILDDFELNEEGYYFSTWYQTHGTLFQAIQLEKRIIGLLIFLIVTVACFNILSNLLMTVKNKESDIAILRTLHMQQYQIVVIFLTQGLLIGLLGIVIGVILGFLITPNLDSILAFLEELTSRSVLDAYFINYFPYYFNTEQILLIIISSLVITLVFSWIPAQKASKVMPAQVLRHE
ncbi:MAG: lipoprotein-releasing ABC transporter permease subunit [Gammaproteobacteria bacterium]